MEREERIFRADDGRAIRGQLSGPRDGFPLFTHMGTPGSCHIWDGFVEAGADRGLRHICCSRPGYEGSDRRPGRSFGDVAAEIAAVADQLGLDQFYVIGLSVGADSALACAALLPERVKAAVAMAGFAPRAAKGLDWMTDMGELNEREFARLEAGPLELERHIWAQIEASAGIETTEQVLGDLVGIVDEVDLAVSTGSFLEWQLAETQRVARDGVWGWYDDDWAIWGDWGFDPREIAVPISVWHGGRDPFIPFGHGEWLASNIPGARAHLLPEEGHMSLWAKHYGTALDEMLELARK